MNEKLLKIIIESLKKKGGNESLISLLSIEDENGIEDAIASLTDSDLGFAELLKTKDFQSEMDKVIGKALKKREENLKKKYNFIKKDDGDDSVDDNDDDDDLVDDKGKSKGKPRDTRYDKLESSLDEIKNMVINQQKNLGLEKSQDYAKNLLTENKIPEKYIRMFDFDEEDLNLDNQFKTIQSDFKDLTQSIRDDIVPTKGFPNPEKLSGKASEDELKEIAKNI